MPQLNEKPDAQGAGLFGLETEATVEVDSASGVIVAPCVIEAQGFIGDLHFEGCDEPFSGITRLYNIEAVFECPNCGYQALARAGTKFLRQLPGFAPQHTRFIQEKSK